MSDAWKTFGITMIVLLSFISLILIFSYLSQECNTNNDCSIEEICAVNHKCVPLAKTTRLDIASPIILGTAIIIAAYIVKGKKWKLNGKKNEKKE